MSLKPTYACYIHNISPKRIPKTIQNLMTSGAPPSTITASYTDTRKYTSLPYHGIQELSMEKNDHPLVPMPTTFCRRNGRRPCNQRLGTHLLQCRTGLW